MHILMEFIKAVLNERKPHGSFSFNELNNFKTLQEKYKYLKKYLEFIDAGSSRATFILTNSKIIKLAISMAGYAQNKAEYEVFSKATNKDILPWIFNKAPDFSWMVIELVRPLEASRAGEKEFKRLTGIDFPVFHTFFYKLTDASSDKELDEIIDKSIRGLVQWIKDEPQSDLSTLKRQIQQLQKIKNNEFIRSLILSTYNLDLMPADFKKVEHYGKTADGRIVVLDTGYTHEVFKKHYKKLKSDEDRPIYDDPTEFEPTETGPTKKY